MFGCSNVTSCGLTGNRGARRTRRDLLPQIKDCPPPRGGGSARACLRYILGEELSHKVEHGQRDDPLQVSQLTDIEAIYAEARLLPEFGVGQPWSPIAGGGTRPRTIYAEGVTSLETAEFDMEAIARANPQVRQPVHHIVVSLTEEQSKIVSDEKLIAVAKYALEYAGFAGHQAVYAIHADTENTHAHIAVNSVHKHTLQAVERQRLWDRLHMGMRMAEIHFGLPFENGLAVVRDADLPTQRVEWATREERQAWKRERGIVAERLEDMARSYVADTDGLEEPEDRRERIVTALRKMLDSVQERGEMPLRGDVHRIAAELAATVESGPQGELLVRLMNRAEKGTIQRTGIDQFGSPTTRVARWTPSDDVFEIAPEEIAPGPLDDGSLGTYDERQQHSRAVARRAWLADLGDVERAEREVEELLRFDPGRPVRDIIAGGKATFGSEEINAWTCSLMSVDGPEWAEYVVQHDPNLIARSADTKHPLLTTKAQLEIEQRVFVRAGALAAQRDPLFNREALERAIADEEKTLGLTFSDQQRRVFDLLEYRFGVLQGDPGTAKSTIMSVVSRYCQTTNRPTIGLATAQLAAENLAKKADIHSVNSTRALTLEKARGQSLIARKAWALADEGSMFDLAAADAIFERLERHPDTCVLYLGDDSQLPNISAGNTFRVLTAAAKEHGRYAEVTQVFRQREGTAVAWMRDAIPRLGRAIRKDDAAGVAAGFQEFVTRGHVVFHPDRWSEVRARAADLVAAAQRGERCIAPGFSHIEAKFVNREIRRALGHEGKGVKYKLEQRVREFTVGDRVRFQKNAESKLGVLNGYRGTVQTVEPRRIDIALDDTGRVVSIDPRKYPHIEWAWALTTHAAQGQGVEVVYASLTPQDSTRSAFVALTRCESGLTVHTHMKPDDLIEHFCSPKALQPKEDALLYEEAVRRTGGPNSYWAVATRRAIENANDPLRQQHAHEMQERDETRGRAVLDVLAQYSQKHELLGKIRDNELRTKREVSLEGAKRRELAAIYRKFPSQSFRAWAIAHRNEISHNALQLERQVEFAEEHREQRERYTTVRAEKRKQERQQTRNLEKEIRVVLQEIAAEREREITLDTRTAIEPWAGVVVFSGRNARGDRSIILDVGDDHLVRIDVDADRAYPLSLLEVGRGYSATERSEDGLFLEVQTIDHSRGPE